MLTLSSHCADLITMEPYYCCFVLVTGLTVLEGSEKSLGKDHPSTIDVVFCLAGLYHKQGKLEDAVVMYQRAMTSTTMTLGI